MKIGKLIAAAACVAAIGGVLPAKADSQLFPGISTGIPLGVPLPEGVFAVSIGTTGTRDVGADVKINALAPAWMIWSTPWTIAGGKVLLDTVTPYVDVDVNDVGIVSGWSNTLLDAQLKWDLGKGLFGGFQAGVYLPSNSDTGRDWTSFQGVGAISYMGGGKNLSATAIYGTGKDSAGAPDWFNLDLTATQKFGKWELGVVAFSSTDLEKNGLGYKASQTAIGPLVGYDFGKFSVQAKYTKTISESHYGGDDSRFWLTFVTPLYIKK